MKSLLLIVISCLSAFCVLAQTVTITSTANRTRQIMVDDKSYSITVSTTDGASTASTSSVVITDLQPGQHKLQILRGNSANSNSGRDNSTTFTLRKGYDKLITINRDGSIQQKETRIGRGENVRKTAMTTASYNTILNTVKKQRTLTTKTAEVKKAFNNSKNYFTSLQAKGLIQLISSQSSRLELAKLSYKKITDPDNFYELEEILTEPNQEALAMYVETYKANNPTTTNTRVNNNTNTSSGNQSNPNKTVMSNAAFNTLHRDIEREWRSTEKMTALSNAFTNTNNYFSTNQAGRLIQLVSNENDRLQLAKASYRSITDPTNFSQIQELLPSQTSRDALTAYVNWYTGTNASGTTPVNTTTKTQMSTTNFNKLVQDVKDEWMPGAKMNLLTNAFANTYNYFSTNQAGQLIQLVSDEDNRLALAKSSYRNITDPTNFTQLYQLFSYQANRDALAEYVRTSSNTSSTGTQYKTPMSDANFNKLVNDVKAQWLPFGKMSALTTIFANPDYYFTSSQAKQLIILVSDEDNRLQLAKSSYRNITDRPNFTLLYDLFTEQPLKDALASYVSSYRDSAGY